MNKVVDQLKSLPYTLGMKMIQKLKLLYLAIKTNLLKTDETMPPELLESWANTLGKTECNVKALAQFANNAGIHSGAFHRMVNLDYSGENYNEETDDWEVEDES